MTLEPSQNSICSLHITWSLSICNLCHHQCIHYTKVTHCWPLLLLVVPFYLSLYSHSHSLWSVDNILSLMHSKLHYCLSVCLSKNCSPNSMYVKWNWISTFLPLHFCLNICLAAIWLIGTGTNLTYILEFLTSRIEGYICTVFGWIKLNHKLLCLWLPSLDRFIALSLSFAFIDLFGLWRQFLSLKCVCLLVCDLNFNCNRFPLIQVH